MRSTDVLAGFPFFCLAASLAACGPGATPAKVPVSGAPLKTRAFKPSVAVFVDPERGFMDGAPLELGPDAQPAAYAAARASGHSLAYARVMLDKFRAKPIDRAYLDAIDASFSGIRDAGIKVVLRFVYNDSEHGDDAPEKVILGHVTQVAPILEKNQDVIAVVQAGFIGHWGEWHGSSSGLSEPAPPDARNRILQALLAAVPPARSVQVRAPRYKADLFGDGFAPLSADPKHPASRVGHHNDCFLASDSDFGTYAAPIDGWKARLAQDTVHVPMGGETCSHQPPRTDCATAKAELERLHFSYLNDRYEPKVLSGWQEQGCREEISRRLGHRLTLVEAAWPELAPPDGIVEVRMKLRNEGWARLMSSRRAVIVVDDGATRHEATNAEIDLRSVAPGADVTFTTRVQLRGARPGKARVILRMPDAAPSLATRVDYALRCANDDVWDATKGDNVLGTDLLIEGAPGTPDASGGTSGQR